MQNLNTDLRLENCDRDEHFLRIRADTLDGNEISIVLNIFFNNKMVDLCGENIIDEQIHSHDSEYFHLDKFQVGVLIDYLKRVRKTM
jgi:hypothetical protein